MELSFEHSWSGLLIFLAAFIAALVSYFVYFRGPESKLLSGSQRGFLAVLRFLALLVVFLFLLSPLIERIKKIKQRPVLVVAFDNSKSVKEYLPAFEKFKEKLENNLSKDYQLDFWTFGNQTKDSTALTGEESRSDYGQLIKSIKSNYTNKNIGALILVGDGIYNQGQNPVSMASELKFPVYSLGVGDTTRQTDAIIRNVRTNKTAYLNNKFPVEIEMKFSGLKDQIAYFSIENAGVSVYSGSVSVKSDDDFKLEFTNPQATKPGLQHYTVKIQPLQGESNLKNNEVEFVIQVLENKQKILLLSDGPHPDLGAIRNSLAGMQNYDVKLVTGDAVPDSLSSYGLIVLNQLPSAKNAAIRLLQQVMATRIPVLFLIGPNSLIPQFNALEAGLQVAPDRQVEEVQPKFDQNFSLFVMSEEAQQTLESMPPLVAPFGTTTIYPQLQTLATQNVKGINTAKVLMAFGMIKGRKIGFVVGEGLWRWRLADFEETGNHEAFDELVQKVVQYLALKENEDNFNVYCQALFQETDEVEFIAELYNDSYELVNTPEVDITIKNEAQNEFKFLFDRVEDHYALNAGNFSAGDYTFEASTRLGSQKYTEKGTFSVVKNEIETQNTVADFGVLYQLAEQSGGRFFTLNDDDLLVREISQNKQIAVQVHRQVVQDEWINLKLLFFALAVLLGLEWFFRKYWGIY